MRPPVVDYRQFKFSKINNPEFSHLKLFSGWLIYFLMFYLTEKLIPVKECCVIHCRLDDLIPFCEFFVIPYVLWYFLIAGSLLYFLFYNVESFKKLQTYIILTQFIAMAVYIAFPNMQDLRPESFPRDNFSTDLVGLLYTVDTNTNVLPSLHVAISIAIASVWAKEKTVSVVFRAFIIIFAITICLSTVFIKQHSILDGFASLVMCAIIEVIIYRKYYHLKR